MGKLVTMVIPVYNTGERLRPCLEACLNQNYHNLQIVIVDDGSKDELTQKICREYAAKDKRIKLVRKENGGEGSARNRGIEEADGEYLFWVDSDDIVTKDFVNTLVDGMEKGYELSICGFKEVKGEETINETKGEARELTRAQAMEILMQEDGYKGYVWNKMFRMDIIKKYKIRCALDIPIWPDVLFGFTYMCHIEKIFYNPKQVYTYFFWEDSISHAKNHVLGVEKSFAAIRAEQQMEEMLTWDYENVKRQMSIRYVQNALAVIRNVGYQKAGTQDEYYKKSLLILKKHKKTAMPYLSKKEKILTNICCICPGVLLLLYRLR